MDLAEWLASSTADRTGPRPGAAQAGVLSAVPSAEPLEGTGTDE